MKNKALPRRFLIAILMVVIGIWLIMKSDGQVYGDFIGITFFIMAITAIADKEYVVKFGST